MKVFFIGRSEFLFDSILEISKKHEVVGIVTGKSMPEYDRSQEDFKKLAIRFNCPFLEKKKIDADVIELAKKSRADICITFNWVSIIHDNFTSIFNGQVFNCHFGDLPKYRGNAVINWAMLNGEECVGVSVHKVEPSNLDSGEIALKEYVMLDNLSITELIAKLRKIVPSLFFNFVNMLEAKSIKLSSQNDSSKRPFRCFPRIPSYSKIDWSESSELVLKLINCSTHPYSGAYSYFLIKGKLRKIFIWKARATYKYSDDLFNPGHILEIDKNTKSVVVGTGSGAIEIIDISLVDSNESICVTAVFKSIRESFVYDLDDYVTRLESRLERVEFLLQDRK